MPSSYPLKKLLKETFSLALLNVFLISVFTLLKNPYFGLDMESEVDLPIFNIAATLILFVFFEELFFRYFPFKTWKFFFRGNTSFWIVGVLTSTVFALAHMAFELGSMIAFPQFFSGMYFWHLIRQDSGFKLAFLSHCFYNLIFITPILILTLLGF